MKLSIITINYNNAEGLRKTLASVASQTYADIEHIIVDGGSTDGSVEVIREYEQSLASRLSPLASRLKWISEKDKGIYNAMNKGIEIALGKRVVNDDHTSSPIANSQLPIALTDYIQILNSGDILAAPDVTERMMAALEENVKQQHQQQNTNNHSVMEQHTITANENNALSPNSLIASSPIQNRPAIFYGNIIKEYPDGRRVKDTCGGGDYTPESFLYFYRGTLNPDGTLFHCSLFEKYGFFNENMRICSDWEWFIRAVVLGNETPVHIDVDTILFDMTGISESGGKNRDIIQKERREYLESILPRSVLADYDKYSFPIIQYQRLKKYHLWGLVYLIERITFKIEKFYNNLKCR
jgi:glycosyltransferase involved in cell wall biosynthesis